MNNEDIANSTVIFELALHAGNERKSKMQVCVRYTKNRRKWKYSNSFHFSQYFWVWQVYLSASSTFCIAQSPVTIVEDKEFRRICTRYVDTGYRTFTSVIFRPVELLKLRISKALKQTKGAVIFDGWTENNNYFACAVVSYTSFTFTEEKSKVVEYSKAWTAKLSPFSLSRNSNFENFSTLGGDEATKFGAECHLKLFRETFHVYQLNFDDWCLCLIEDTATVIIVFLDYAINRKFVALATNWTYESMSLCDIHQYCRNIT